MLLPLETAWPRHGRRFSPRFRRRGRAPRSSASPVQRRPDGWQDRRRRTGGRRDPPHSAPLRDLVRALRGHDRAVDALPLRPPVRVLLQSVIHLHEADGRGHDEFATSSLLVACRERTLAQQIEFVLIETALQAEQEAIIALPWGIDCLLVDQHRVDYATHLDELLPVAAVTGKARDLPGRHSSDLAEADVRHHPLEAGAGDATCRRAAEIVVNRLDLAPA